MSEVDIDQSSGDPRPGRPGLREVRRKHARMALDVLAALAGDTEQPGDVRLRSALALIELADMRTLRFAQPTTI